MRGHDLGRQCPDLLITLLVIRILHKSQTGLRESLQSPRPEQPIGFLHGAPFESVRGTQCKERKQPWLRQPPMFELTFLGTAASTPSAERGLPALLVAAGGRRFVIAFGQGSQPASLR